MARSTLVRALLAALASVVLLPCGCAMPDYVETDWHYAWPDPDLPVALSSLRLGWQLFEGDGVDFGVPREAFALLIAEHETQGVRIMRAPADFSGVVRIKSARQALEYVRLATSTETWHLFGERDFLEPAKIHVREFPEDAIEVSSTDSEEVDYGQIPRARFEELGLHAPVVIPVRGGFRILRCLAWYDSPESVEGSSVFWTEELVGYDGQYKMVKRILAAANVDVLFRVIPM